MSEPQSQFPIAIYLERFGIPPQDVSKAGYQPKMSPTLQLVSLADNAQKLRRPVVAPRGSFRHSIIAGAGQMLVYKPRLGCFVEALTVQTNPARVFSTPTNPVAPPITAPASLKSGEYPLPGTWQSGVGTSQDSFIFALGTYHNSDARLLWVPPGHYLYIDGNALATVVSAVLSEPIV